VLSAVTASPCTVLLSPEEPTRSRIALRSTHLWPPTCLSCAAWQDEELSDLLAMLMA